MADAGGRVAEAAAVDARAFRTALGRFATGIVVVSVRGEGTCHAMTANAFMSGSLEPPLIVVSVGHRARMHTVLLQAERFGVAMLDRVHEEYSRHFAGQSPARTEPAFSDLGGAPVLQAGSARIGALVIARYPCGDHTLFVGRVEALALDSGADPLLFHAGKYAGLVPAGYATSGNRSDELPFFY